MDDPFVVLESTSTPVTSPPSVFIDPVETVHKMNNSESTNTGVSGGVFDFDYIGPLHGFGKHAPAFPTETNNKEKDQSPYKEGLRSSTRRDPTDKSSFRFPETQSEKAHVEDFQDSQETIFDMPPVSKTSHRSVDQTIFPPSYTETSSQELEQEQPSDDIWLTVSEIPLFTQTQGQQNLVMHSRSNKIAVAEAGGVQLVLDLIGSGDTDTSIQAAMFFKLLFSKNTIQEYASSETVRAITAAIEKDLWATGTVHEEHILALNTLFGNFPRLRAFEPATLSIPHLVTSLKTGSEATQEAALDALFLLRLAWSACPADVSRSQSNLRIIFTPYETTEYQR
ncbi:hypothetical protein Lser_V15G06399 [Lactuca serriola]